jgi:hypothetical protein
MNIMINTLEFAEAFETAGFGHDQAKALAVAFGKSHEASREDLVTIAHLDTRLAEFETRFMQAIADQSMSLTKAVADQNVALTKAIADQNVSLTKAISEVGKDLNGRLWSTVAIIAGVSTAISATIGAGMVLFLRSGGL